MLGPFIRLIIKLKESASFVCRKDVAFFSHTHTHHTLTITHTHTHTRFLQSISGKSELEDDDIAPILDRLREQLVDKNVAAKVRF